MNYKMDKGVLTSIDMKQPKYKVLYWLMFSILLVGGVLICILPVVWIFLTGFKDANEIYDLSSGFFPKRIDLGKIATVWNAMKFYKYYLNTFVMAGGDIVFTIIVGGVAGYVLSKVKPLGHRIIFTTLFTLTLMPGTCRTVPLYMMFSDFPYLHISMLETYWPMWIMAASDIFNIILFKNFFDGISTSLVEAAKIDGASDLKIFFQIMIPLALPIFWVVGLFTFNGAMGTFFWPYLLITSPEKRVLGVQIYNLKTSTFSIDYQLLGLLFAMLPQLIIFGLFQKRIMGGVNIGAVKG